MLKWSKRPVIKIDFQTPREQAKRGEFHPDVHMKLANSIAEKVKSMVSTQKRGESLANSIHVQKIKRASSGLMNTIGNRVHMSITGRAHPDHENDPCVAGLRSMSRSSSLSAVSLSSHSRSPDRSKPLEPIRTLARPSTKHKGERSRRSCTSRRTAPILGRRGDRQTVFNASKRSSESSVDSCLGSPRDISEQTMTFEIEEMEEMVRKKQELLKRLEERRRSENIAYGTPLARDKRGNSWYLAGDATPRLGEPLDRWPVTPRRPCPVTPRSVCGSPRTPACRTPARTSRKYYLPPCQRVHNEPGPISAMNTRWTSEKPSTSDIQSNLAVRLSPRISRQVARSQISARLCPGTI